MHLRQVIITIYGHITLDSPPSIRNTRHACDKWKRNPSIYPHPLLPLPLCPADSSRRVYAW